MITSSRLLSASLVSALLLTALGTSPAEAARARPDLVVSSGSVSATTATVGATVRVTFVARNSGAASARRSIAHVDLVSGKTAIRLAAPAVPALSRRARKSATAGAKVPSISAGTYRVRVCVDARRQVTEGNEKNNCRYLGSLTVSKPTDGGSGQVPTLPTMDPGDTTIDSFSATSPQVIPASLVVQQMKAACSRTHAVKPMGLSAALASLDARLKRDAADGVARLSASPAYDDPIALQKLAATGVAKGSPGLALAALLRTAELEPTVGTHLVNAAALATTLGQPNEAIALLDAAATRKARTPALGVPIPVLSATVRGQALVMTGRLEEARRWFTAVRAAAPMLTEADTGLATVEACGGSIARAERLVQRSRVRTHDKTTPDEVPVEVDPATRVDLQAGKASTLRRLPLAQSPAQAVAMNSRYLDIANQTNDEITANNDRLDQALVQLDAADADASLAERTRRASLIELGQTLSTPDADRLEARIEREGEEVQKIWDEFWPGPNSTFGRIAAESQTACAGGPAGCEMKYINEKCRPALAATHRRWVVAMDRLQAAADDRLRDLSLARSSVAANLAEPSAHEIVMLNIAEVERSLYALLDGRAMQWSTQVAGFEVYCVAPLPPELMDLPDKVDPATEGPCPDDLKKISVKAGFDDPVLDSSYEMKINCEKISGEVSLEVLPMLFAFAELAVDYRAGTVTLMGGAKGKIGGGPIEGSFKSGLFVSVDAHTGSIKDVGWQVGPEVTASKAGIEVSAYQDEVDFSFVSGLTGD